MAPILNIKINLKDELLANAVYKALLPETKIRLRNVKVNLKLSGEVVEIVIEAPNLSSLRATSNALLRLTDTVIKVISSIGART